jgi:16S rRNA (uracil1498-N3)-methyltransferase
VIERWRRIALASTKQCGRARCTRIEPIRTLDDVLTLPPRRTLVLVEPSLRVEADSTPLPRVGVVNVLSGPEGGWSSEELARIRETGANPLSLGPMTLRAEVAPVAALGVLSWWATRRSSPEP